MDKSRVYKGNVLKSKGIRKGIADVFFPTRYEDCTFLEATDPEGIVRCILCMDHLPGEAMGLHLYIPEDNRNTNNILIMREMFYALIHPWIKQQGKNSVIVNCSSNDTKTMQLFETFGFTVEVSAFGMMSVEGE